MNKHAVRLSLATLVAALLLGTVGLHLHAADFPKPEMVARMEFAETDIRDVLMFYRALAGKTIWIDSSIVVAVDVPLTRQVSNKEAMAIIDRTLLHDFGIEVKDVPGKGIFIGWSEDPKYQSLVKRFRGYKGGPLPTKDYGVL